MARPTVSLYGADARKAIMAGVRAVGKPVAATFGPQGRNALLFRTFNRGSRITNDGYTVAECQVPKNIFQRLAAETFKEACKKTNEKVGDGTTGTAILGWKLMEEVYSLLSEKGSTMTAKQTSRVGVMTLRNKILESAEKVKTAIRESAKKIETLEELEKVAIVSVEDEELGKVVARMAWDVGVDGFIDVVEGYKGEIETEVIKGFRFPAKVADPAFVNNKARYEMVATDCVVLITNYALDNAGELGPIYTRINQQGISKIITIAPSFSVNVLTNMALATKDGYFQYPVAAPSLRTEQFLDLAIYCGAIFIDKTKGKLLRSVQVSDLGFLGKLIVKSSEAKEDAVATGGRGAEEQEVVEFREVDNPEKKGPRKVKVSEKKMTTAVAERVKEMKAQMEETRQEVQKKLLERRIASMASAIGTIRVGDTTDASALYRKLKIEDAVYACRAALRNGYVKGGGICLKEIAKTLPDDDILKKVLEAPYEQIQNSVEGGVTIGKEIIDAADAIYYAVSHAVSVVANLATVETITPEMEDPIHGEGEYAIARALAELTMAQKKQWGILKEGEEEVWNDGMRQNFGTDNIEEAVAMDRG